MPKTSPTTPSKWAVLTDPLIVDLHPHVNREADARLIEALRAILVYHKRLSSKKFRTLLKSWIAEKEQAHD